MFETTDIYLASYLKCKGEDLVSVTVDGRKGTFTFAREPVRLIHDFQLGLGHVEPMTYTTALRGLTSICKRKAMA